MALKRIARCACGGISIELRGNPEAVAVCHCTHCQRRTGSAFGVSAYFRKEDLVATSGDAQHYARGSDSGRHVETSFCGNCGSTVWWDAEFLPGHVGTAVGCFTDPGFPPPLVSVWEQTKHPWVKLNPMIMPFTQQPSGRTNKILEALKLSKPIYFIHQLPVFRKARRASGTPDRCAMEELESLLSGAPTGHP
jgi:hypothetical protein